MTIVIALISFLAPNASSIFADATALHALPAWTNYIAPDPGHSTLLAQSLLPWVWLRMGYHMTRINEHVEPQIILFGVPIRFRHTTMPLLTSVILHHGTHTHTHRHLISHATTTTYSKGRPPKRVGATRARAHSIRCVYIYIDDVFIYHDHLKLTKTDLHRLLRTPKRSDPPSVVRHRLRGAAEICRRPGDLVLRDLQAPHHLRRRNGGFTRPKMENSKDFQGENDEIYEGDMMKMRKYEKMEVPRGFINDGDLWNLRNWKETWWRSIRMEGKSWGEGANNWRTEQLNWSIRDVTNKGST